MKAKLTWFEPRKTWKKKVRGKVHYLKGDGSGQPTEASKAVALFELGRILEAAADGVRGELEAWNKEQYAEVAEKFGQPTARKIWNVPDITLEVAVGNYQADKLARFQQGEIVADTYEQSRVITNQMRETFAKLQPPVLAVNQITADSLSRYRSWVLNGNEYSASTRRDLLRFCKWFVTWAWENGKLFDMPRNINSFAKLKLTKEKEVAYFSIEQVKALLPLASTKVQKLYILLMTNCGFSYQDISDLKPSEFKGDYIERQRSKTAVPGKWLLWKETKKLLTQFAKSEGANLLTDNKGQPLIKNKLVGNVIKRSNPIECSLKTRFFGRKDVKALVASWKMSKATPYMFRKSGANWVETASDKDTAKTYLAHSDGSVAEVNYLTRKYSKLTKALKAIEGKLF